MSEKIGTVLTKNGALGRAMLYAIAISVIGFGVMSVFWYFYPKDTGLLGLTDYFAATFGDGIYLPLLVGSAYFFDRTGVPPTRFQKRIALLIGVIFGLLGILIQASWLVSDTTGLNWTIPELHTFNLAGWYHAVYFVLMLAICAYSFVRVMFSRYNGRKDQESMCRVLTYAVFWLALSGYFFLHGQDDWTKQLTNIDAILVFLALSISIAVVVSVLSTLRLRYIDIVSVLAGVFCAAGITNFIIGDTTGVPNSLLVVFAFALMSSALVRPCLTSVSNTIMSAILISMASFGLLVVTMLPLQIEIRIAMGIGSLLLLILVFFLYNYKLPMEVVKNGEALLTNRDLAPILIVAGVFVYDFLTSIFQQPIPELVDLLLYGLAFAGIVYHIFDIYKSVKDLERVPKKESWILHTQKVTKAQQTVFALTSIMGTGVFIAILTSLYSIYNVGQFAEMAILIPELSSTRIIVLVGIVIVILIASVLSRLHDCSKRLLGIPFIAIGYLMVTLYVFDFRTPYLDNPYYLLFVLCIPGSCLFVAESFASNVRNIRGIQLDFSTRITTLIIFIGSTIVLTCSALPTCDELNLYLPSITSPLVGLLGVLIATVVLPYLSFLLIEKPTPKFQVADNTPGMGVLQGGVTGSIIALFAVLVPFHLVAVWSSAEIPGLAVFVGVIVYIGAIMLAVEKPIENSREHFIDRKLKAKQLIAENPKYEAEILLQLEQISKHLKRQTKIFVAGLLPWSLFPLIHMWFTKGQDQAGLTFAQFAESYFFVPLSDLSSGKVDPPDSEL